MAGQAPPTASASQVSLSVIPAISPAIQQLSSVSTTSASGGSGLAPSPGSGLVSSLGAMVSGSSQASAASASTPSGLQHNNAQMQQQTLSNPSSQTSMLGHHVSLQTYQQSLQNQQANVPAHLQTQMPVQSSGGQSIGQNSSAQHLAQQQNQLSGQQGLGQNSHLTQQMLNQNQKQQQQQQQQGRQSQYSQSLQINSQAQQGSSLQQGNPASQTQPVHNIPHNIPRVSSAQRLLQMQQPGGGLSGIRGSSLITAGPHFNQQLSPALSVSSPGGVGMSPNVSLQQQQQQQQQQQLLAQRGYQGQQQQSSLPAQQRLQQTAQQASQLSQQNQHALQAQQVPSPNQSLPQQLHASSRPSLYSQPMGSQFGHHLQQQAGVSSRLGTAGTSQVQGPGLPSMLSVPPTQPFVGLQSQLTSPQQSMQARQKQAQAQNPHFQPGVAPSPPLQGLPTMAMMSSGGLSASGGLATQLARTSTPLTAQQQRMQQQGARLQQQTQQLAQPEQPQQQQQQSNLPSPSKQQNPQQLSRLPSLGSMGSQMQSLPSAQQNSNLQSQTQPWLPAGPMKPVHSQSPSVPYPSQVHQQQLQASQQRSQQPQLSSQQQQQQAVTSPVGLQQPQPQQQQPPPQQQQAPAPGPAQASSQQQQRAQVSANQRPITPTGPQPATTSSAAQAINAGPSSHASDSSGKILGKRSIQDLVAQVDPREKLDPDVEDVLLEIADDFVETVTSFACALAKHRKSPMLEAKDVLLHLERNWHMTIPGFSGDDYRAYKKPSVSETHKQRLAVVRKSLASTHPTQETKGVQLPGVEKANSGLQPAKTVPATLSITSSRFHRVQ